MTNRNFTEGMIAWCDFNKSEARLFEKIHENIITFLKNDNKTIQRMNKFFNRKKIKKLPLKQFKPEAWKDRPVLIIHLHKRMKSAIVLPLTTRKPKGKEERKTSIPFPKDKKPSVLNKKKTSWILCDMPYHVSIDKLEKAKRSSKIVDALIDKDIYKEVIRKYKEIIADDIV